MTYKPKKHVEVMERLTTPSATALSVDWNGSDVDTGVVLVAGTFTVLDATNCTGSTSAGARMTYTAKENIDIIIEVAGIVESASGANEPYSFFIRKNGTSGTIIQHSRMDLEIDSNTPQTISLFAHDHAVQNDYYEMCVAASSGSTAADITAKSLTLMLVKQNGN